jgi:hypothetical protein
VDIF